MTLLKGDKSLNEAKASLLQHADPGLTVTDGLRFGIGFWSALIFAIPVILFILVIIAWVLIMIFGGLVGGLL